MARRRGRRAARTVYRKGKTIYRSRGGMTSAFKPVLAGVVGGAAGGLAAKHLPLGAYAQPIAHIGVGWFMKNPTLMTIGGMELGASFFGGNGVVKAGFWES